MLEMNKIYNEDCLEFMKKVPDKYFDLIFCDYPFNMQDGKPKKCYDNFIEDTAKEFHRITTDDANIIIVNTPHSIFKHSKFFEFAELRNGVALIRRGSLRPSTMFGFQHNYMLMLYKGGDKKRKWRGTLKNHDKTEKTDVIHYQNGYRGKGKDFHPQAMPLDLVTELIYKNTNSGDKVFDPFMGSGTTALACETLELNWCGCELKKEYFEMANKRLKQMQRSLF